MDVPRRLILAGKEVTIPEEGDEEGWQDLRNRYPTARSTTTALPEYVDVLPKMICTSCNKRLGSVNASVRDNILKGLTMEQAFEVEGLRFCCRMSIMSDEVLFNVKQDPEMSRGLPSSEESALRWRGHMRIYSESNLKEGSKKPVESWTKPAPEGRVPPGYRFVEWLVVPGIQGKPDMYTMRIQKHAPKVYTTSSASTLRK